MRRSWFGREREREKNKGWTSTLMTWLPTLQSNSCNLVAIWRFLPSTWDECWRWKREYLQKFWRIWGVIDDSSPKSIQKNNGQGINFVQFYHFVTPFITRSLPLCMFGVGWAERLLMVWFIRISKEGLLWGKNNHSTSDNDKTKEPLIDQP